MPRVLFVPVRAPASLITQRCGIRYLSIARRATLISHRYAYNTRIGQYLLTYLRASVSGWAYHTPVEQYRRTGRYAYLDPYRIVSVDWGQRITP